MAQHRAAQSKGTARRMPRRLRTGLWILGAFLGVMYLYGSHLQDEAARAAQPIPTPSVTSAGKLDEPVPSVVQAPPTTVTSTVQAAPTTVYVTEQPAPITATTTAAPATVTSTEYPADVVVTETEHPAHTTVTETAPQQTITEVIRPERAVQSVDPLTMAPCINEDGADAGQEFPCVWDATQRGNGKGTSFWLEGPLDDNPAHKF